MSHESRLLDSAMESIKRTFARRATTSLLSGRDGLLPMASETLTSADDMELVTWLVVIVTKLPSFISLVCDQKTNRSKKDNHGIRPLPNLETKFVAADTLIGLPIPEPDLFITSLIAPIEKEIEDAYHGHFSIQRRDQKLTLQKKIKTLRLKLADTIVNGLGAKKNAEITQKARHVAEWDPFDPQSTADFFDPHWMFGRSLKDGFDIVDFDEDVFESATVKTCILLLGKTPSKQHNVKVAIVSAARDVESLNIRSISQDKFAKNYKSNFDLSSETSFDAIKSKMSAGSVSLGSLLDVSFGLKTGDDEKCLSMHPSTQQHRKLLRGQDIGRYTVKFKGEYLQWKASESWNPRPGKHSGSRNHEISSTCARSSKPSTTAPTHSAKPSTNSKPSTPSASSKARPDQTSRLTQQTDLSILPSQ